MEAADNLLLGFSLALTPANLFWCFVGVFLGTIVGILPGLGPPATIAMLLPLTFRMDHTTAIIMLSGIYYGAKYGGSTTSILLNVPGEPVAELVAGYRTALDAAENESAVTNGPLRSLVGRSFTRGHFARSV